MIQRNEDLATAIAEIEAHHAARRAKGKAISTAALERLAQMREELASPKEDESYRPRTRMSAATRTAFAMAAMASSMSPPPPFRRQFPR